MSFAKVLVVLCLSFASVSSLATPHAVRHNAHHRALAARVAVPEPLDVPTLPLQRRQNTRRCKQRSSSAQAPASTRASSSSVVQHTPVTTRASQTTPATTQAARTTTTKAAAAPTTVIKKPTTTPAPVAAAPTTTRAAAAPTTKQSTGSSSNLPSFLVGTQTGQGTFYSTGLGACGITNNDNQHIAAVSHLLFDSYPGYNGVNPNNNPMCGRTVTATYQGKSVTVAVTDRCEGCALTDLDFSPSAFNQLADFSVGRISGMTWVWN